MKGTGRPAGMYPVATLRRDGRLCLISASYGSKDTVRQTLLRTYCNDRTLRLFLTGETGADPLNRRILHGKQLSHRMRGYVRDWPTVYRRTGNQEAGAR